MCVSSEGCSGLPPREQTWTLLLRRPVNCLALGAMDRLSGGAAREVGVTPRFTVAPTTTSFVVDFASLLRSHAAAHPHAAVRPITSLTAAPPKEDVFEGSDDDDSSASSEDSLGMDPHTTQAAQKGDKWAAIIAKHTAFATDGCGGDDDEGDESDDGEEDDASSEDLEGASAGEVGVLANQ